MAKCFVDQLEIVQVNEQQGALPRTDGACQQLLKPHEQKVAVGQPGQRVIVGQGVDRCLGLLVLGEIKESAHVVGQPTLFIAYRIDAQPLGIQLTGFATIPDFSLPVIAARHLVPQGAVEVLVLEARAQQVRCLPDGVLHGIASDFRECAVDLEDLHVRVGDQHGFLGLLEGNRGDTQIGFHGTLLGDVVEGGHHSVGKRAALAVDRLRVDGYPAPLAGGLSDAHDHV